MTHSGDNNSFSQNGDREVLPRVAYTLGDIQNVRSTYIAHDPYFFGDVDDALLEEELSRELDQGVHFAYTDISSYTMDEDEALIHMADFDDAFEIITEQIHVAGANIEACLEILAQSRYAATLISFAKDNNIHFEHSPATCGITYNRAENIILVQPMLDELNMMKGLICALRKAWQNHQGALLQAVSLYPDHAVFMNRAQKADALVSLIRTGWELHLAGESALWEDLECDAMGDMAQAFAREAALDFRSINNGQAALAAFEGWFLSDRSRASDSDLIQKLLSDYSGHQFEDEEMSQLVLIDLIKALGHMPYGKNYLAWNIPVLLTDPIFTEVRERASANFLWFIKFEKTFNEVERALQSENTSANATFPGADSQTDQDGSQHDNAQPSYGEIIAFPLIQGSTGARRESQPTTSDDDNVIPFDIAIRPFNRNFFKN